MTNDKPDQLEAITNKLEQGVKDFLKSGRFDEYLKVMSKFHHYSINNSLLIAMQKPDASIVAGYNTWKKEFERNVIKGEKAIKILAPTPYKIKVLVDKEEENGILGKEEVEITIPKFKIVNVFDISQTEGKELPELVSPLKGDVNQYQTLFKALTKVSSVSVEFENIKKRGAHGYYHQGEKRIVINEGESEIQTIKTLIHEIAHSKLHDHDTNKKSGIEEKDKFTKEVEAESIAYVVCQHFAIDTSEYSFGYVASWSSTKELEELKASLETIRTTSKELIESIENSLLELQKENNRYHKSFGKEKPSVLQKLKENQKNVLELGSGEKEERRREKEVEL